MTDVNAYQEGLTLTPESLLRAITDGLQQTTTSLSRVVGYIKAAEERNISVDHVMRGSSFISCLKLAARGRLLIEIVTRFASSPLIMRRCERLSLQEQQKLANGDPLPVAEFTQSGEITHRLVQPREMVQSQIYQVFGPDKIRNLEEQVSWLRNRQPQSLPGPRSVNKWTISKKPKGIIVREAGTLLTMNELQSILTSLNSR